MQQQQQHTKAKSNSLFPLSSKRIIQSLAPLPKAKAKSVTHESAVFGERQAEQQPNTATATATASVTEGGTETKETKETKGDDDNDDSSSSSSSLSKTTGATVENLPPEATLASATATTTATPVPTPAKPTPSTVDKSTARVGDSGYLPKPTPTIPTKPNQMYAVVEETKEPFPYTYLMIDVEACNPSMGPVLAIGCVLAEYHGIGQYNVLQRHTWIVDRGDHEYSLEGMAFWKNQQAFHTLRNSRCRMSAYNVALSFRQYINECWRCYKKCPFSILIDDVITDGALLNQFLATYAMYPIDCDENRVHQTGLYNARDLMRGSMAMLNPRFRNLSQAGMYKAINTAWMNEMQMDQMVYTQQPIWDDTIIGPRVKHLPAFDSQESVDLFFQNADLIRLFSCSSS